MKFYKIRLLACCVVFMVSLTAQIVFAEDFSNVPVKGMVTMVDLGAKKCVPCKMMAPIMVKLEKAYEGKAAIIFIDVWKKENKEQGSRFKINAIPTQIFLTSRERRCSGMWGFLKKNQLLTNSPKWGLQNPSLKARGHNNA